MTAPTDEQIIAAIDSAPLVVQEVLRSGGTAKVIAEIGATHRLHIDQIGRLAQINRNLLVGLVAPAEMYGELVEMGVSAEEARQIMAEINEKVFLPLREKMRGTSTEDHDATHGMARPLTAPTPHATLSTVRPTPQSALQQPLVPLPQVAQAPHTQVFASTGGWPGAPTGNWQPAAAVHVYVPSPAPIQPPTPAVTVVPHPAMEPRPAQPTAPIVQAAPTQPRPVPTPPQNLPGAPTPDSSIEKSYVADPYREPPV